MKPGNLLFDEKGEIYVGDFGVARLDFSEDGGLTRTEALVGTPNYLSPEVASGEVSRGSVKADLYGLGAILYECLTGQRPHEGAENLAAQLRQIVDVEVKPVRHMNPEIERDLGVICDKALAHSPDDRYETVAGFVDDLQRWREGREIQARPASVPEKVIRWSRRHPVAAGALVAFTIFLVSVAFLLADNYKKRGEVVQQLLLENAMAERLVKKPGFRERGLNLLLQAQEVQSSSTIRNEAIALLAHWDASKDERDVHELPSGIVSTIDFVDEGIRLSGGQVGRGSWTIPSGALRCDPAWSQDGRFLALVSGMRMEVVIYDVSGRKEFGRVAVNAWPEKVQFRQDSETLEVFFEGGVSSLANVRGDLLLEQFETQRTLSSPVGFKAWEGQALSDVEARPYRGTLSRDGKFFATASVLGVQIWSVAKRLSVEFFGVENQRIDAPTDIWWVGPRQLILQVPGALEVLALDSQGRVLKKQKLARVPGSKVLDIRTDGDWVVEVRDEDGEVQRQIWPQGDFGKPTDLGPEAESGVEESEKKGDVVTFKEWTLTLPHGGTVLQSFPLEEEERVIVLTSDYLVCDWDLGLLKDELSRLGF